MINTREGSLILLTYNDKLLLMLQDNRLNSSLNIWGFIGGSKRKNESFEEAILRTIAQETGLQLPKVTFVTTLLYDEKEKYVYHAILTADNLNNIKRGESQNLDFLTLPEVEKLTLAKETKLFLAQYKDIIKKILQN